MENNTVKVGLVGFGTIGGGVADILLNKKEEIRRRTGRSIELVKICDKDTTSDRGVKIPGGILTDDLSEIINSPIDIVIELIGGLEPARTFVLDFLRAGKDVVTANKALVANHGPELFDEARRLGRTIAFEASVCGGIPILSSIATSLQANTIISIDAICNGTSNFILSQMEGKGADYDDAVKEAQRLGYAEANPSMDVDGTDAVQKLTIMAQLAFGVKTDWKSIPRTGIDIVKALDIRFARKLGKRIRLLATAKRVGCDTQAQTASAGVELKVSPTLVPETSPLAKVCDAFNAVQIIGDFVGPVFYQGLGAGRKPTASAVCSDVIDTALGRTRTTFGALNLWSPDRESVPVIEPDATTEKAYLRFKVEDHPGVLAKTTGILGQHGISISSLLQDAAEDGTGANLIILTHEAPSGQLAAAIEEIDESSFVLEKTVKMSVRD
ncbi:MAG: homoserine dehydrogenase [Thermoguttaceae bacterium]|nr:homoserine dehydrogenase [Thermoguttaceae bacterium]